MIKKKPKLAIAGVKKIILVVSGKGGVGKSTVAVNIAMSLQKQGFKTGLLDADIYGPSLPKIFGISEKPELIDGYLKTFERHNIRLMSMGFLVDENVAVIWRGPMTTKALHQLFLMTKWAEPKEELDYLIVDTPPGTGDVHLSIVENFKVDSAVVVTTPNELSIQDTFKSVNMLDKLNITIIGLIENMSYLLGKDGNKLEIFGQSRLDKLCEEKNINYLGALPLVPEIANEYFFKNQNTTFNEVIKQITSR